MNILIVSRTPWNRNNSFGNTFCNLFEGMDDVNVYSLCCQAGATNVDFIKACLQFDDHSVLRSVLGKDAGRMVELGSNAIERNAPDSKKRSIRRNTFTLMGRDVIWNIGRWKHSAALKSFLQNVRPDVIYLPMYASWYMCDVQSYIMEYYKYTPVVGHITDDIYCYPAEKCISWAAYFYRWVLRRKIRRLMAKVSYCEVFAESMAHVYAREFGKPFYLIGKGLDLRLFNPKPYTKHFPLRFAYTGNMGDERWNVLVMLARAIDGVFAKGAAQLDIYSQTILPSTQLHELTDCVCVTFHGAVDVQQVLHIQSESDYLIHVESFSASAVYSTRMSFSTKIVDYMLAGKPIIAIGPAVVNSIELLKSNNLGHVACSEQELRDVITGIQSQRLNDNEILRNVNRYVTEHHDRDKIQKDIYARLRGLLSN